MAKCKVLTGSAAKGLIFQVAYSGEVAVRSGAIDVARHRCHLPSPCRAEPFLGLSVAVQISAGCMSEVREHVTGFPEEDSDSSVHYGLPTVEVAMCYIYPPPRLLLLISDYHYQQQQQQ